jgi:hypothetical protein
MLVLGWFVHNEVNAGFGDGVRDASIRPDWLVGVDLSWLNEASRTALQKISTLASAGNLYFCLIAAYCLARIFRQETVGPRFGWDGLVTYLGFSLILIAAIGPNLATTWPAPFCFALVAAAFGVGYFLLSSQSATDEAAGNRQQLRLNAEDRNLERWGLFLGLVYGLGLSLRKLLKGGSHLYLANYGDEKYWDPTCWKWVAAGMLVCLLAGLAWFLACRVSVDFGGDVFPHAAAIFWLVLIVENVVAQVVTGPVVGPHARWDDFQFNLFYLVLFALTGALTYHFQFVSSQSRQSESD